MSFFLTDDDDDDDTLFHFLLVPLLQSMSDQSASHVSWTQMIYVCV